MKTNYFIVGDAIEKMQRLPNESIDLVATDPPYNLGKNYGNNIDYKEWHDYQLFTERWLSEAVRVLKSSGSIYVFMGVRFISKLFTLMEEKGLLFNGWITWHYTQGMGRTLGFSPRHEDLLYFTKSSNFTFNLDDIRVPQKYFRERNNMKGANPGDVWLFSHVHYSNPERQPHPTQKPLAVMERIIKASSNKGDLVLDPFVGSGSTCVAANALDRKWIGIDTNPDYIKMSKKRISEIYSPDSFDPRQSRTPRDLKKNVNQKGLLF
ncbi:MAG TPA: site-specific DNA-methyltransferase [Patescibacteria group bacterium]